MVSVSLASFSLAGVAFLSILWELTVRDMLFVSAGIGRSMQPLSDFPYTCRRLVSPQLEACEDLWLDDEKRILYAACSGTSDRLHWNPAMDVFNTTGRKGTSQMVMLDIDSPGADGFFNARPMTTTGYTGALGGKDKALDLHGFDVEKLEGDKLRFWLINHRPRVGPDGEFLDAVKLGQNSSIEVFEAKRGDTELRHIRTVSDPTIWAPNKVAATGTGGFVLTNDKSGMPGFRRRLDLAIGGGALTYCALAAQPLAPPQCRIGASKYISMANGMVRGRDGLYYVPSSSSGDHKVMRLFPDGEMTPVAFVETGMPLDNFAVDANGDIWAAGFPKLLETVKSLHDPEYDAPTTIFKVRRVGGWINHPDHEKPEYEVEKMIEDDTGHVLSGITVARLDVKTGRVFAGAAVSPFMVVCDPKA